MTKELNEIRKAIESGAISYDDIAYLQQHIAEVKASGDIALAEWAGIEEEEWNNVKDVNWSVDFEITINGIAKKFWELSEANQRYILACISGNSYSGTFAN